MSFNINPDEEMEIGCCNECGSPRVKVNDGDDLAFYIMERVERSLMGPLFKEINDLKERLVFYTNHLNNRIYNLEAKKNNESK